MTIPPDTIDHATLERLVEAGAVHGACVVGQPGGWGVVVQYGMVERRLAAKRGAVRIFRRFETLVSYLSNIGITKYQVDASHFDPAARKAEHKRADAAERMKNAHAAAAHHQWFKEQVEIGLAEADAPSADWVTHDEANVSWAKKRAELLERAGRSTV